MPTLRSLGRSSAAHGAREPREREEQSPAPVLAPSHNTGQTLPYSLRPRRVKTHYPC